MNCEIAEPYLLDVLDGVTPVPPEVEAHLHTCATCADTLADLRAGRALLQALPAEAPPPALRTTFYTWLEAAKPSPRRAPVFALPPYWRPLAACLLLALASAWFFLGRTPESPPTPWLDNASSSARIAGIYTAADAPSLHPQVRDALLETLRHDPSPNVRMAAIDVLGRSMQRRALAPQLAQYLPRESSPAVQLAVLRSLGAFAAGGGRPQVQTLLARPDLEPTVRAVADSTLLLPS